MFFKTHFKKVKSYIFGIFKKNVKDVFSITGFEYGGLKLNVSAKLCEYRMCTIQEIAARISK